MKKIKLGILGASEIAFRRFLPALTKYSSFEYVGIASRITEKAQPFQNQFGGQIYSNYDALLDDSNIEAVYLPLPPSLHFEWAKKALKQGKHILLEKPSTTRLSDTVELIKLAQERNLAIHENYMFIFHKQISTLRDLLAQKIVGEVREYRIDFGFPKRSADDFRYNKALGGGALLDCGGYPIKLASLLLGDSIDMSFAHLKYTPDFDVDLYGTAVFKNDFNQIAKVSFGMDNAYKCSVEVWGSEGTIFTDRIFTAPSDFSPTFIIKKGNEESTITVDSDDQFLNSIDYFAQCIQDPNMREQSFLQIHKQSELIEKILKITKERV